VRDEEWRLEMTKNEAKAIKWLKSVRDNAYIFCGEILVTVIPIPANINLPSAGY